MDMVMESEKDNEKGGAAPNGECPPRPLSWKLPSNRGLPILKKQGNVCNNSHRKKIGAWFGEDVHIYYDYTAKKANYDQTVAARWPVAGGHQKTNHERNHH